MEVLYDQKEIEAILPIFATAKYMQIKSHDFGWFKTEKYILPFYKERISIFNTIVFTSQTIKKDTNATIEDEKQFLEEVVYTAAKMGCHFIRPPLNNSVFCIFPKGSIAVPYGKYIVDLTLNEDELFARMHQKHRNVIRKAQKEKVEILSGYEFADECHQIIYNTMRRHGLSWGNLKFCHKLRDALGDNIKFYISRKNGCTQGAAIVLWNKNGSHYAYGGSIERPILGALNYLHWHIMLDMKKNGVKLYDLYAIKKNPKDGSKDKGIQDFKKRFGGDLKMGYLWKYPINKIYYPAFYPLVAVRQKLFGKYFPIDIIDQELQRLKKVES